MNVIKRLFVTVVSILACLATLGSASAATTTATGCGNGDTALTLNANPNCPDTDTCTLEYLTDERIPLEFRKDECMNADYCTLEYLIDGRIPLEFRKDACNRPASPATDATASAALQFQFDADDSSNWLVCQSGETRQICMLPE